MTEKKSKSWFSKPFNLTGCVFGLLIVAYLIRLLTDQSIIIHPIKIYGGLQLNMDGTLLAQICFDDIKSIGTASTTLFPKRDVELYHEDLNLDVPFIKQKISIDQAKGLIQTVFNLSDNEINGDIQPTGTDCLEVTLRYNNEPPVTASGKKSDIKNIVHEAVLRLYSTFDPMVLINYYATQYEDVKAVEQIKLMLQKPQSKLTGWMYNAWGIILVRNDLDEEGEIKLKQSIALDSTFFLPYYNLGLMHVKKRDYSGAMSYLKKSLSLNAKYDHAFVMIAAINVSLQNYRVADSLVNIALSLNKDNNAATTLKGDVRMKVNKDTLGAISLYERAENMTNKPSELAMNYKTIAILRLLQHRDSDAKYLMIKAVDTVKADFSKHLLPIQSLDNDISYCEAYAKILGIINEKSDSIAFKRNILEPLAAKRAASLKLQAMIRNLL